MQSTGYHSHLQKWDSHELDKFINLSKPLPHYYVGKRLLQLLEEFLYYKKLDNRPAL